MSRKKIFFIVLVFMTFLTLQTFVFIEANLREPLMNIAKVRVKQMATQAINTAITQRIAQETEVRNLIEWTTDRSGKPTSLVLNHAEHMQIASNTVQVVQNTLDNLQKFPEYIPLGQALNSAILASFGPDIPVRFVPAGATQVSMNIRQKDAGINMVLVEVYIDISVEVSIIIPFGTDREVVTTEVPITYVLVAGDVPMYYFDNKGQPLGGTDNWGGVAPPNISLPSPVETEAMLKNETGDAAGEQNAAP
jgi:sporulation protein YunB